MRSLVIGLIIIAVLIISKMLNLYVDWLFFKEVTYGGVFMKILSSKILAGVIVGVVSFVFMLINALRVSKARFPVMQIAFGNQMGVSLNTDLLNKISRPVSFLIAAVIGVFAGIWGSSIWYQVLLFFNAATTGMKDPVLGKDIGFYLFKLPFYESLSLYAGFMIFLALLMVILGYP